MESGLQGGILGVLIRRAIVNFIESTIDGVARAEGLDGVAELMEKRPGLAAHKLRLIALICNANADSIMIRGRRKRLWAAAGARLELMADRLDRGRYCSMSMLTSKEVYDE